MYRDMEDLRNSIINVNPLTIEKSLAMVAKSIVYLADSLRKKEVHYMHAAKLNSDDDGTRPRIFC